MQMIKNYFISLGITFGLIIIFSFFINLFNYFELINQNIYKFILVIFASISIFIGSFILGKKTNKKGYLEGIKYGLIACVMMFIISFLAFDNSFNLSSFIYYLILMIVSVLGGVFGINKKKEV